MQKLKFLKFITILLLVIDIPFVLFFLALVLPEYLACINCDSDGAMGTDIWGGEVQCFGESKEFGELFFKLILLIISGLTILILAGFFLLNYFKKNLKSNLYF